MLATFLFASLSLSIIARSSELVGFYEFWDYYSTYIFDNSLNSRSLLLTPSQISPILTDRGLYLTDNTSIKFPGDSTSSFPSFEIDWVISMWYLPIQTSTIMTLHIQDYTISMILEEDQGKLVIATSYQGNLLRQQLESPFRSWRLFSIRLMQTSLGSSYSYFIDGIESQESNSIKINDFRFSDHISAWEIGSGLIQGYIYQVWWHIDVDDTSILSTELISTCSDCESSCILAPTERCLGTTQDPFYNSTSQLCSTNCTSVGLSCSTSEECIESCTFPCLESSTCRSFETPSCPDPCPANCVCYPSTDFCTSCNLGYIPSNSTAGRCEPSVPHCTSFNQTTAECILCETGYYLNTTDIPVCTVCPEDCLKCRFYLNRVYCTLCPEPLYTQVSGFSPYCAEDCPLYTIADSRTVLRCLSCPTWCPYCEISVEDNIIKCKECLPNYYIQPNFKCNSTCIEGYYGDNTWPASCKPCIDGCKICANNYECLECHWYFYLESDTKLCKRCVDRCIECQASLGCNRCEDGTYLVPELTRCNNCAHGCKFCYTQNNCYDCFRGYILVPMGGYHLCKLFCFTWEYILEEYLTCAFCRDNRCMMCDSNISPTVCTSCPFTSRAPEVCTDIPCPSNCIQCSLSNSIPYCHTCKWKFYLQPYTRECLPYCPEFYYPYEFACHSCTDNCKTCTNRDSCMECGVDYYIQPDNKSCRLNCPERYYPNPSPPAKCFSCVNRCLYCTSESNCYLCETGYFALTPITGLASCVDRCPTGYYGDIDKICKVCRELCISCRLSALKSYVCRRCEVGYMVIQNECVPLDCDPNCINCILTSTDSICNACSAGYYILPSGYECGTSCPSDSLVDPIHMRCHGCPEDCEICIMFNSTATTCTKCYDGYVFALDSGRNLCVEGTCPSFCLECYRFVDNYECIKCEENYFIHPNKDSCVTECPLGYYPEATLGKCVMCENNCDDCNGPACVRCSSGYYLYQEDCYSTCIVGYYGDPNDRLCKECPENCAECGFEGYVKCFKCKNGRYLQPNFGCEMDCPSEYYKESGNMICEACMSQCKVCEVTNGSLVCNECNLNHFLQPGLTACSLNCPFNYYKDFSDIILRCTSCITNCKVCTNSEDCSECTSDYALQPVGSTLLCDKTCPETYYISISTGYKVCKKCPEDCKTCTSITCTECYNDLYIQPTGGCLNTCPEGYFYNDSLIYKACTACLTDCKTCTSTTDCQACKLNRYYHTSNSIVFCLATCPDTFYANTTTQSCSPCQSKCRKCSDPISCIDCISGNYLQPSSYSQRCDSNCPAYYYKNDELTYRACTECKDKCSSCNSTTCFLCDSGYYIQPDPAYCGLECGDKYFKDLSGVPRCTTCQSGCFVCNSMLDCSACDLGLFLQPSGSVFCKNTCPEYYFLDSSSAPHKCSSCASDCKTCTEATICIDCRPGYYLQPSGTDLCLTTCPSYYYKNDVPTYKTCSICQNNCLSCDASSCYLCDIGYYIQPTSDIHCKQDCPLTYYKDSSPNPKCSPCQANCSICNSPSDCSECIPTYFLQPSGSSTLCLTTCPEYYFLDSSSAPYKCSSCASDCKTCTEATICIDCRSGYYLQPSGPDLCLTSCPSYYYKNDVAAYKTCSACQTNCISCNATDCFLCDIGYYIQPTSDIHCKQDCPLTYYKDSSPNPKCSSCQINCSICNSPSDCSECIPTYFLQPSGSSNFCLTTCPEYYFSDYSSLPYKCSSCASDCKTCTEATICIDCRPGYYLQPSGLDLCLTTCPYTYFPNSSIIPHKCSLCKSNCKICPNSTSCSYCIDTFYLQPSPNPSCSLTCPDFYFQDSHSIPSCSPCLSYCKTCINSYECLACAEPYYIQPEKHCNLSCPYFYFKDEVLPKICTACPANCKVCSNESECIECGDGYFMQPFGTEFCLETCPVEYYPHIITKTCRKCPYLCKDCYGEYDELVCGECVENASKVGIDCVCDSGYIEDISENICREAECRVKYNPKVYKDFGYVVMMSLGNVCELDIGIDTGLSCVNVLRENYYTQFTKQDFSYSIQTFISSSSNYSISISYLSSAFLKCQIFPSIDFSGIPIIFISNLELFQTITTPSSLLLSGFLTFPTSGFIFLSATSSSDAKLYLKGMNIPIKSNTPKVFTLYFMKNKIYPIEIALSTISSVTFSMKWSLDGVTYDTFTDNMLSYDDKSIVNPTGIYNCEGVLDISQPLENGISYCDFLCKECSVQLAEPISDLNSGIENITEECKVCVEHATLNNSLCSCNSGFYHSSSRIEACLPCEFPCETCQEIKSVFECLTCIPPYSLDNTACICDPQEYELIDSACLIKPLRAVFISSINSISISFNKKITNKFEAEYISLTYPSYISYDLISYNISIHNDSQAADLNFYYPMKIDRNIEVYIEMKDVFIDRQNVTLNKLEYIVEMRLKNDTGIEEEAPYSESNSNSAGCPELCTACDMVNGNYMCSICEEYAYLRDNLCYCFDRQNQVNQYICPKSCPSDMQEEIALRTCIYPNITQESAPEPEPEPTEPVYTPQEIDQAKQVSSTTTTVSNTSSGSTVAISVLTANLDKAWSLMNTIQIFSYLPLLQVDMPLLMQEALKSQSQSWIPEFIADILSVKTVPYKKAYDFKFKSPLFLKNSERQILTLFLIIILHVIVFLLTRITKGKLLILSMSVYKQFYWAVYLRFYIQMYFDLCVSSFLQIIYVRFIQPNQDNTIEHVSYVISLLASTIFTISPFLMFYFIYSNYDYICLGRFKDTWGTLTKEFDDNKRSAVIYYPLFLCRRIILTACFHLMKDHPMAQAIIAPTVCWMVIYKQFFVYVVIVRPFSTRSVNLFQILNEMNISMAYSFACLLYFNTGLENSISSWTVISFVYACYIMHLGVMIGSFVKVIYNFLKRCFNRIRIRYRNAKFNTLERSEQENIK